MEQCNDGAGFASKSLQDLRNISTDWNLNGDRALLEILENIHKDVITRVNKTNKNHEKLAIDLNKASLSLININNRFSELCNTQFIENKVHEDDITLDNENEQADNAEKLANIPSKGKDDNETKEIIATAISKSLLELKGLCDEISLSSDSDSDSDDSDAKEKGYNNVILKPKDIYAENYLPHIIGTNKWKNKWHIGLRECSSGSESDEANSKHSQQEEYSSSDESIAESTDDDEDSISNRKKQMTLPIKHDNTSSNASIHDDNISDKLESEISKMERRLPYMKTIEQISEPKPPQTMVPPSDFAAELARKLGSNVPDPIQTSPKPAKTIESDNKSNKKANINKTSIYNPVLSDKPSSRITGNIFSDEPPPLESSTGVKSNNIFDPGESTEDYVSSGLFGDGPDTPPQTSNNFFNSADLFGKKQTSNYGSLFDDVPDYNDTFVKSNIKKTQTKTDNESDSDIFGGNKNNKKPQNISNVAKTEAKKDNKIKTNYNDGSLFDDEESESDDNLFGPPKKIQAKTASHENSGLTNAVKKSETKTNNAKKVHSLFDDYSDSDDDLFGSSSKIKSVPHTIKKTNEPPKKVLSDSPPDNPLFEPKKNIDKPVDNKKGFLADSDDELFGSYNKNKTNTTTSIKKPSEKLFDDPPKKIEKTKLQEDDIFEKKKPISNQSIKIPISDSDDLFGSTSKVITKTDQKKKPETQHKPKISSTISEDKKNMNRSNNNKNDLFSDDLFGNKEASEPVKKHIENQGLDKSLKKPEISIKPNTTVSEEKKSVINHPVVDKDQLIINADDTFETKTKTDPDDLFGSASKINQKKKIDKTKIQENDIFEKNKSISNQSIKDDAISDSDDLFGSINKPVMKIDQKKKPEIQHKPKISSTLSEDKKNINTSNKNKNDLFSDDLFGNNMNKETNETGTIESPNKLEENKTSVHPSKKPEIPYKPSNSDNLIEPKKIINDISQINTENQKKNLDNIVTEPPKPDLKPNVNLSNGLFDDIPPPLDDANETDNIYGDDDDLFSNFGQSKASKGEDKSASAGLFDNVYDNSRKVDLFSDEPPDYTSQTIDNDSTNDYSDIYADYPYYKTVNHIETSKSTSATVNINDKMSVTAEKPPIDTTMSKKVKKDHLFYDSDDDLFETSKNKIKKSVFFDEVSDDDNIFTNTSKSKPTVTTNLPPVESIVEKVVPKIIESEKNTTKPVIETGKLVIEDKHDQKIKINESDVNKLETPILTKDRIRNAKSITSNEETDGLLFSKPPVNEEKPENKLPPRKIGKLNTNLNINVQALLPGANKTVKEIEKSTKKPEIETSDIKNDDINPPIDSSNISNEPNTVNESNTLSNSALKDRVKIQVKRRPPTRKARHEAARKSAADIYNFSSTVEAEKTEFVYSLPNSPVKEQSKSTDIENPAPKKQVEIVEDKQPDVVAKNVIEIKPDKKDIATKKPIVKVTEDKTKGAIKKKTVSNLFSDSDSDSDLFTAKPKSNQYIKAADDKKDLFQSHKNNDSMKSIFDDDADDLFAKPKKSSIKTNDDTKKTKDTTKKPSKIFDDDSDDEFNIFKTKKESKPTTSVIENVKVNQIPKTKTKTSSSFKDPLSSFLDD